MSTRALIEVNGIRGELGLGPLERLAPPPGGGPLAAAIPRSILAGAPATWTCRWGSRDVLEIARPGHDEVLIVVPPGATDGATTTTLDLAAGEQLVLV